MGDFGKCEGTYFDKIAIARTKLFYCFWLSHWIIIIKGQLSRLLIKLESMRSRYLFVSIP